MFGFSWKKLTTAENTRTKEINVVELWYVRWTSRHGEYSRDVREELEAFPSKDDAEEFATALRNAFKLIRHTSANRVTVTNNRVEKL